MNKEKYCQLLEESLLWTLRDHGLDKEEIIFQQDNDPKHTSKLAKAWFTRNGIEVLSWPANSPDMNPIEHAWAELEHKVQCRDPHPTNIEELWVALQEEWETLQLSYREELYKSMPRQVNALGVAKGLYTKY